MGGNTIARRPDFFTTTTAVRIFGRLFVVIAVGIVSAFLSATAAPAFERGSWTAERLLKEIDLLTSARVVCEQRKEGDKIRTFFCPDGNTCFKDGGTWKCRSAQAPQTPQTPRPGPTQSCADCDVQRSRCFTGCDNNPNLQARAECVNRCNAAYKCVIGYDCR
jgi:hypothetical protein